MWSYDYATATDVSRSALWRALTAIHEGSVHAPGGDVFEPHGALAVGTEMTVTPAGQGSFRSTIVELADGERYADRTEFGDVVLTFRHTFTDRPDGGTWVVHGLVIDGPGADATAPRLGPQIVADFDADLDNLIELARSR